MGAGFIGCDFVRSTLAKTDHFVTFLDALTYAGDEASLFGLPNNRFAFVKGSICDKLLLDDHVADRPVRGRP